MVYPIRGVWLSGHPRPEPALADPDAILASNSSSYPARQFTDRAVLDLLLRVLPGYGIHPFEARRESTGFIFNRIWAAIKREALAVVAEGVSTPQEVDRMWQINSGSQAGPFRMMDKVGLDVVLDIEDHYAAERPELPAGPRELLHRYVDAGHLGVKSGRGFSDDYGTGG
ncbi:3-hydroxyacyl-CoA dehydrogenase family protein [Streptomyces sp. PsTaAH-124]|uniref:3-hydroxyacyl-CoA dehydrogenase family protein n=1 Tax=Streptomyces sp. PsTaAH-124 TaxID=1157638 RepID=UPI000362E32C|nr:3-hydroxyacyl-CoA dehydrogenase family protein [Streptomyces sp. PsTaAH-124]